MTKNTLHTGPGVVLRFGELFLKGKNRFIFEQALENNARRLFAHRDDVKIVRKHGRIFLLGSHDTEMLRSLKGLFGISSYSPAQFCEKEIKAMGTLAVSMAQDVIKGGSYKTFRISAKRADKSFPHNSTEIGRVIGSDVAVATGLGVDLEQPDLTVGVEVGPEWTFVWTSSVRGAGGLPVGTGGRAMLLLSGGIDSPVAGHFLQKRGLELAAIYFHAFPYTGDGAKEKVVDLARILAARQKKMQLHVVQFAKIQEHIRDGASEAYRVIMYRRCMFRIAQALAKKLNIVVLATGESLGQVASQTIANLVTIEDVAEMPVLRPLLTFDKIETIDVARDIGSFETSIIPHDDCCTLFVPKHPETKSKASQARYYEDLMELDPLIEEAISTIETIDL